MRKQTLHPRTAVINKKQKNNSKTARLEALSWLSQTFPHAFDNSTQIRPLKLGIMADVLEHADAAAKHGISRSKLREAVVVFARRLDYLTCLKAREMRVDLNGNSTTIVSEEEAERAALKIRKRIEKGIKNARKQALDNAANSVKSSSSTQKSDEASEKVDASHNQPAWVAQHYYPDRTFASSTMLNNSNELSKRTVAPVVIKRKTSRSYDPEVVARLKEKLGLTRKDKEELASTEKA